MANSQLTGVLESVDSASQAEDELEIARQVHGLFELEAKAGEKPGTRLREVAALMGMAAARVRRYLALHVAPAEIKEHFRVGRLSGRVVEMLQALSRPNQLILARRIMSNDITLNSAHHLIAAETGAPVGRTGWSEEALALENAVLRAIDALDPYLDAPRGRLYATLKGAGGGLGRRALVALLDEHIELLGTLKQTIEHYTDTRGTDGRSDRADREAAVGSAADTS